jgi:hypothetical protein
MWEGKEKKRKEKSDCAGEGEERTGFATRSPRFICEDHLDVCGTLIARSLPVLVVHHFYDFYLKRCLIFISSLDGTFGLKSGYFLAGHRVTELCKSKLVGVE